MYQGFALAYNCLSCRLFMNLVINSVWAFFFSIKQLGRFHPWSPRVWRNGPSWSAISVICFCWSYQIPPSWIWSLEREGRSSWGKYICCSCNFPFLNVVMFPQINRLYLLLTVKESAMDVPSNLEARRRISFFSNSLFMDMPTAPKVRNMLSFS